MNKTSNSPELVNGQDLIVMLLLFDVHGNKDLKASQSTNNSCDQSELVVKRNACDQDLNHITVLFEGSNACA